MLNCAHDQVTQEMTLQCFKKPRFCVCKLSNFTIICKSNYGPVYICSVVIEVNYEGSGKEPAI